MIDRLISQNVFACHCELRPNGILVGILVLKSALESPSSLFDPECNNYYQFKQVSLEAGIHYSEFLPYDTAISG